MPWNIIYNFDLDKPCVVRIFTSTSWFKHPQLKVLPDNTEDVEYALDVADKMAKETSERYTHEEVFSKLRGTVNE